MIREYQKPLQAYTINSNLIPEVSESNLESFLDTLSGGNIFFFQVATAAAVQIGLPNARYTGIYHRYADGLQNLIFFPISDDTKVYKKYRTSASTPWSSWISG